MTAHMGNHSNALQPRGDVATKDVAQTNENRERMSAAAAEAARFVNNMYSTTINGTQMYSTKVLEFAQVNTDAAFEYVKQLSSVKSQAEFFALSNDRVRQQFEVLFRQAQELTAIARKVTVATTERLKRVNKAV
jgi:hypothetical protein